MRVDRFQAKDVMSLARICRAFASLSEEPSREEVHFCCKALAAQGVWTSRQDVKLDTAGVEEDDDAGNGQDDTLAANSPAQGPTQAPLAVVQDFAACKDDAAATEVFRQCVETAAALASAND